MDNDGLLGRFFSIFTAPAAAWAAVLAALVAWFKTRPLIIRALSERHRDEALHEAGDWERIRNERDRLRDLLAKCDEEKAEWMRRAIIAEATLQGYGEARQLRAIEEAKKRLSEPEDGNG